MAIAGARQLLQLCEEIVEDKGIKTLNLSLFNNFFLIASILYCEQLLYIFCIELNTLTILT